MNENIDNDFVDVVEDSKHKPYVIVIMLYIVVIILVIFLILGLKNQKEIVNNNINAQDQIVGDNKWKKIKGV